MQLCHALATAYHLYLPKWQSRDTVAGLTSLGPSLASVSSLLIVSALVKASTLCLTCTAPPRQLRRPNVLVLVLGKGDSLNLVEGDLLRDVSGCSVPSVAHRSDSQQTPSFLAALLRVFCGGPVVTGGRVSDSFWLPRHGVSFSSWRSLVISDLMGETSMESSDGPCVTSLGGPGS